MRMNTSLPEPKLSGRKLARVNVEIKPSGSFAHITEELCFERYTDEWGKVVVGETQETRFQHGMNPKFSVTKFEATVINGSFFDSAPKPEVCKIVAVVKEKKEARREFNAAIQAGNQAIYAETDIKGDSFALSLGAIKKQHSVKVVFSYLAELEMFRKPFLLNKRPSNEPIGYDLHLPVAFKPKYTTNPGQDINHVTGIGSVKIQEAQNNSSVRIVGDNGLHRVINLNNDHNPELQQLPPENDDSVEFEFNLTPEKPDVRLRMYFESSDLESNKSTSDSKQFLSQNIGACMVKFSNLLPNNHHLFDKYGVIVDYSLRRNQMAQMKALPKKQYDFLIDCSGSMAGSAINQTKIALKLALQKLPSDNSCYITLSKFGNSFEWWKGQPVMLNERTREEALCWVDNLSANMGGTEMKQALEKVLDQQYDPEFKKQMILITDAAVYNYDKIVEAVRVRTNQVDSNGDLDRVFVLGVGESVAPGLCNAIAEAGGGIAEFAAADTTISEKVEKLLVYASQRSPDPLFQKGLQVHFTDKLNNSSITDFKPASAYSGNGQTGFFRLFSTCPSDPAENEKITKEMTHFRLGYIFDKVPKKLHINITLGWSESTGGEVQQEQAEKTIELAGEDNPVYWSYIKAEMIRREKNLEVMGLNSSINSSTLNSQKQELILLSTTTKLLCPFTAFIGVKKTVNAGVPAAILPDQIIHDQFSNTETAETRSVGGPDRRQVAGSKNGPSGHSKQTVQQKSPVTSPMKRFVSVGSVTGKIPFTPETKVLVSKLFKVTLFDERDQPLSELIQLIAECVSNKSLDLIQKNKDFLMTILFIVLAELLNECALYKNKSVKFSERKVNVTRDELTNIKANLNKAYKLK